MKLKILTLNWNGKSKIENLYPGLKHQCDKLIEKKLINSWEWHVKDNGSKDDSVIFLSQCDNTIYYQIGHNRDNFAKGVNFLFEKSSSEDDLILILNNDVQFKNEVSSLEQMILLKNKTNCGIIGAKLNYLGTNKIQHYLVAFSKRYNAMPWHIFSGQEENKTHHANRYCQAVTAAVMITDGKTFNQVNGYDECFNWAFEDTDFCLKVNQLKEKNIATCGNVLIYHEESASLKKNPINKLFVNQNVTTFKTKWNNKYVLDFEDYEKNERFRLINV